MVSVDKEYEFVSAQVRFHIDKIFDSFKLFIQLFSAIVGGSIWLSLQPNMVAKAHTYAAISNALVMLIAALCLVMVVEHNRAWRGNRKAQTRLGGKDETGKDRIPPPGSWRSSSTEIAMGLTVVAAVYLFWRYNPFTI